jgi:hypothetical protein
VVIGLCLPVSSAAAALGLVALPTAYWPILLLTLLAHMALTQLVKMALRRCASI